MNGWLPCHLPLLEFEMLPPSWFSVKDVCRDGGVFKKIIREGMSWATPEDADEVIGEMLT